MFWSAQKRQKINSWIPSCENFLHTYFTYPKPFKRVLCIDWAREHQSLFTLSTILIVSGTFFFLSFCLHMPFTEMQNLKRKKNIPTFIIVTVLTFTAHSVLRTNTKYLKKDQAKNISSRIFFKWKWLVIYIAEFSILLPKLFWPTVRKNCSSDREKLLKFEAESREFANFLRSLEQFIQTVKGQNNFW